MFSDVWAILKMVSNISREEVAERRAAFAAIADYTMQLGDSLEEMAVRLRRGEIPRVAGNRFERLLESFAEVGSQAFTSEHVSQTDRDLLRRLEDAKYLDLDHVHDQELPEGERDERIAEMERLAGRLQADAIRLRRMASPQID